jgi:transcriptional regulator with XRE-family HTH domain
MDTLTVDTENINKLDETRKTMAARELAAEIERLRLLAGWTQKELARRVGVHQTGISDMEKGDHTFPLETVYRLARAFGISPFRLASIYWGIEAEEFVSEDKALLDDILYLIDSYRTVRHPQSKPPTDLGQADTATVKKITLDRRKAQRNKENTRQPKDGDGGEDRSTSQR